LSESVQSVRRRSAAALAEAGIVLRPEEADAIEVTDFGLGRFAEEGLVLLTYVNTDRYCAKELVLGAHQVCPQHRHPPFDGGPGKQETFRCRRGRVHLFVEGAGSSSDGADGLAPKHREEWYTVHEQVVLHAGEQYTIPPNTWHWFAAGPGGAIVSEFSSTSRDELDQWVDPGIVRDPLAGSAEVGA
jgi:D-lyxose ketol-isomerase